MRIANIDRGLLLICILLAAVTLGVFCQAVGFEFTNCDDDVYVYQNPAVRAGLNSQTAKWALTTGHACLWQPAVWMSYMVDSDAAKLASVFVDVDLGKDNAAVYHLSNVILHLIGTLLLFLVINLLTGCRWRSALVAAMFSLHPLHVESVAWVAERKDVLSFVFWMLTIWGYARYVSRPDIKGYGLVIAALVLGLLSKSIVVTLPVVLLLMDFWPLRRLQGKDGAWAWRARIAEKIPFLVLAAASAVVTYLVMRAGGGMQTEDEFPFGVRLANIPVAYVTYILRMFWPTDLATGYPHPMDTLPAWQVIGSTLLLAGITLAAARLMTRRPYVMFGWLWYVITLFPVCGIIAQGRQVVTDHFSYIPLVGLFIIVAWGVPDLLARAIRSDKARLGVLSAGSLAIVAVLTCLSHTQTGYWRDSIALWEHSLRVTRDNALAEGNLGVAYAIDGDTDKAEAHLRSAIRIMPNHRDAHFNLGKILNDQERYREAIPCFRAAIRLAPRDPLAHNSLGIALANTGKIDEAIVEVEKAVRLSPPNSPFSENLDMLEQMKSEDSTK